CVCAIHEHARGVVSSPYADDGARDICVAWGRQLERGAVRRIDSGSLQDDGRCATERRAGSASEGGVAHLERITGGRAGALVSQRLNVAGRRRGDVLEPSRLGRERTGPVLDGDRNISGRGGGFDDRALELGAVEDTHPDATDILDVYVFDR